MAYGDEHVFRRHETEAPSVIGPDYVAEQNGREPTLVYLPSERMLKHDSEATVELRQLEDGRLAVLAYSSLDALVGNCGELQPWVSLPSDKVAEIQQQSGADLVIWDAALPEDQRKGGEDH